MEWNVQYSTFCQKKERKLFACFCLYMHKKALEIYSGWWMLWCTASSLQTPPEMKDSLPQPLRGLLADGLQLTAPVGIDCLFCRESPHLKLCPLPGWYSSSDWSTWGYEGTALHSPLQRVIPALEIFLLHTHGGLLSPSAVYSLS